MELMSIFVNEETKEGLYAIRYDNEEDNEYHRLLRLWSDFENVRIYLQKNEEYLENVFFKRVAINRLAEKIAGETQELGNLFVKAKKMFFAGELKLQEIFWPLYDTQIIYPVHQKTKASIKEWRFRRALVRLYAIRISGNAYVISGGAIKLVRKMEDHPDTRNELRKLESVKAFLQSIELYNEDDLKLFEL
jgi:hypothetical protein